MTLLRSALLASAAIAALTGSALAGPSYEFRLDQTEVSGFPTTGVGTVRLTQIDAETVRVEVDLADGFGFLNTGGPHTPFTFHLDGDGTALDVVTFLDPVNGEVELTRPGKKGKPEIRTERFSYAAGGGSNAPHGWFNSAIEYSAGNGGSNAYYGDLSFEFSREGGISTDDFTQNGSAAVLGYYFAADVVQRSSGRTGSVAADTRTVIAGGPGGGPTEVPGPAAAALFGVGLLGFAAVRRRRG